MLHKLFGFRLYLWHRQGPPLRLLITGYKTQPCVLQDSEILQEYSKHALKSISQHTTAAATTAAAEHIKKKMLLGPKVAAKICSTLSGARGVRVTCRHLATRFVIKWPAWPASIFLLRFGCAVAFGRYLLMISGRAQRRDVAGQHVKASLIINQMHRNDTSWRPTSRGLGDTRAKRCRAKNKKEKQNEWKWRNNTRRRESKWKWKMAAKMLTKSCKRDKISEQWPQEEPYELSRCE